MEKPTYKADLSNEDRVLIHKALSWYKNQGWHEQSRERGPEVYLAIHNRNEEITTLVDGMMGWGLDASMIGYIRMCLAEYVRDQEKEAAKKGPFAAEEFVAHFQELSKKLDKAIDPKAERAWSLSQRNEAGRFVAGNSAASKSDEEKAEQEQIRLYQEDRDNIARLLAVGYAANKTAVIRKALGEAVALHASP